MEKQKQLEAKPQPQIIETLEKILGETKSGEYAKGMKKLVNDLDNDEQISQAIKHIFQVYDYDSETMIRHFDSLKHIVNRKWIMNKIKKMLDPDTKTADYKLFMMSVGQQLLYQEKQIEKI